MKTILHFKEIGKLLFLATLLFGFAKSNAQCTGEILSLHTQADVDNFGITYAGVTDWDGTTLQVGDFSNPSDITNLNGLSNLETLCGALLISNNPLLLNLDGLANLESLAELDIVFNDGLENIDGLSNLVTVTTMFYLDGSPNVTNVDGLQSLNSVGILDLENTNISNLNGLVNLQYITDQLYFVMNSQLLNLSGLENVVSIKNIGIVGCALLNSIDALSNVIIPDYNTETDPYPPYLYITNNPLLGQCSIEAICNQITDPDFDVFVEGNAIGCESVDAISDVCQNLGVAELNLRSVKMYPNLTNSIVNISGDEFSQVKIFDMMGKKVLDAKIEANSFNVEKLSSGRYVARLIGKNGEMVVQDLIVK